MVALSLALSPGVVLAQGPEPKQTAEPKAAAEPKQAAAADEVRAYLDKAAKLYNEGVYDAALIEFQRAYDLSGNYKILYNMGLISAYEKDFASALRYYQGYLAGGSGEIPAARYTEVKKEINRLAGLVAKVELTTNARDAEVHVDDDTVAKTPLSGPLVINPGKHSITLVRGDREIARKAIAIGAGESAKIELRLSDEELAAAEAPAARPGGAGGGTSPAARKDASRGSFPWVSWIATGGLAAGTAVTGVLGLTTHGALTKEKDQQSANEARVEELTSRANAFTITTAVLGGVTAVSLGVSIYLTVRERGGEAPARVTRVEVGPGSIAVGGVF